MRLLLLSDLHYTLPQWDWAVRVAPKYDLVVLAGDHLDISSAVGLDTQALVVLRYFSLLQQTRREGAGGVDGAEAAAEARAETETTTVPPRLAVISGNHDLTGADAQGEQCALWLARARAAGVPTDGDSLLVGDTLVTLCPWWDGPIGRAAVAQQLAAAAARRPARWIWVYHWPPLGSPTCWTGRRSYGDTELGGWIAEHQPDIVLTGHVHEPPFKPAGAWADRIGRTWVFNAGRQIGPVPAHIEIDLAEGSASWHSMMGSETTRLDAAERPERSVF